MIHASLALVLPLTVVLVLLAVSSGVLATRGWTGTLQREGRLGLRTPATSASEAAFALANKVAAPAWAGSAVVGLVAAALIVLGLPTVGAIVVFVVGLIGAVALAAAANGLGERAARSMPVPARAPVATAAGCTDCACGSGSCAGLTRTVTADRAATA